jgi:hypothetical protein
MGDPGVHVDQSLVDAMGGVYQGGFGVRFVVVEGAIV